MAIDARTPGVYVQEVSIFPPSVTSVATAIPAFFGYTARNGKTVARITSMNDYVAIFGGPHKYLRISVAASGSPVSFTVTVDDMVPGSPVSAGKNYSLYYALQMYFANGGGPCFVASTGVYDDPAMNVVNDFDAALALIAKEDEPTLLVAPDARLFSSSTNCYDFYKACLAQCAKLQDRFTIVDIYNSPATSILGASELRGGIGNQNLKYGACYMPDLSTTLTYPDEAVYFDVSAATPDLNGKTLAEAIVFSQIAANTAAAAQLLPIMKQIRDAVALRKIVLAPSSTMAGVYASVDRSRGVWKTPANVGVSRVEKPSIIITHDDQLDLNVPTDGKAINAIRSFTGQGILVWGARTLAGSDNERRYVSVRRLFIMIEESVRKATEWVVFEPNDANTWLKVKTMIENYLLNLWKDGALAGAEPKAAFFVKVGLNQTMTAQDILNGFMYVEIGLAAVRPAEFVVLKFSHKLQES